MGVSVKRNYLEKAHIIVLFSVLICLSCASVKNSGGEQKSLFPLKAGWYQYDFERTLKGIEVERDFFLSTGMNMVYEVTYKYNGVVCRFDDGVLYDPVTELELSMNTEGGISCTENISIKGTMENSRRFFWSGLVEEHGKLNSIFVKGHLTFLPPSVRGGREFDGVYRLRDMGTGREQLANISWGFYTWQYLDRNEAGFNPWPVLIRPDGSFGFGVEITTVAEMGDIARTNTSASYTSAGKVIPGQGITLEELVRTSAQAAAGEESVPQIYAGTNIRSGEFPNEAVPSDIESLISSGKAAANSRPKQNPENYPSWYIKLPVKPGFIYAAGEKTFEVKETAFAIAETAAAAVLVEQISIQIENMVTLSENGSKTLVDDRSKTEIFQRLNYRVVERIYNEKTKTAFVLAETASGINNHPYK
jgi:hypothetical protein